MRRLGDRALALLVAIAATLTVGVASRSEGIARDEAYYLRAGELYAAYWEEAAVDVLHGRFARAVSDPVIERYYSYNSEHPALMKTLYGLSWRLLHRCHCPEDGSLRALPSRARHPSLGLLDDQTAFRFPAALFAGGLAALAYLLARRLCRAHTPWTDSRWPGLVAAALAIFDPQYFFHAEIAEFDAPVAATVLLVAYLYARSFEDPRYAKWTGIAFGVALATKLQAFFLPPILLAHWVYVHRRRLLTWPRPFVHMAVWGPLVFFLHWPHLWHQTWPRLRFYLEFHLKHWHYNFEYLGTNYNNPPYPWHYAAVTTLLTVPLVTLALAAIAFAAYRPDRAGAPPAPRFFLAANVLGPIAVLSLPGTPIFGGVKHFFQGWPFLAVAAGLGARVVAERVAAWRPAAARFAPAAVALLAILPAANETRRSHPYGLSFYNSLAGGFAGGADLGMNRQFWGYAARGLFAWMNRELPKGTRVYFHDLNHDAYMVYVRNGLLRADIADSGVEDAGVLGSEYAMVIHERHFNRHEYMIWDAFGTTRPYRVLTAEGVPLVTVYKRGYR